MLKVIPVEEAVGLRLAHDITEIIPGGHKGPRFRRGHLIAEEDVPRLLDVGKAHIYIMDLASDELHEEDAAKRLAGAAAGDGLTLTDPSEGRVNLVAAQDGMLEVDEELLFRFNELGDLILATLPSGEFVREGTVVGGTRTIPILVKEELVASAEALCQDRSIVTVAAMPAKKVYLLVTGSEVLTGRIKDGFEPAVRPKVEGMGSTLEPATLAPDDPDVIAGHIKDFAAKGAEIILVSGGMSVDPDDLTPEGIRRSGADVISHGFPLLPGSMFLMSYLGDIPVLGLSGCVLHDPVTAFDFMLPKLLAGNRVTREDILRMGHGGLQKKHGHHHH
ncbi:MAG: molybdopterin-binding protein [Deltaproteobacteria bacterium]|nr:molybdopterin-binding protein [Deltaproteobacteria bacterium]